MIEKMKLSCRVDLSYCDCYNGTNDFICIDPNVGVYGPTLQPTILPSQYPTKPSINPTLLPSFPTNIPTIPTLLPTIPTMIPTDETEPPSTAPTPIPHGEPTIIPTFLPIIGYGGEDTDPPSTAPTPIPHPEPTYFPTNQPKNETDEIDTSAGTSAVFHIKNPLITLILLIYLMY